MRAPVRLLCRTRPTAVVVAACLVLGGCAGAGQEPARSGRRHEPQRLTTVWASPGPFDATVLAADGDGAVAVGSVGEVHAYDVAGHERWTADLLNMPVVWRPALSSHAVVVSLGDRVTTLDRETGNVRWERRIVDPGRVALGAGADGVETVVLSTAGADVAALRADTGALRWSYHYPLDVLAAASVTVDGGRVYATLTGAELGRLSVIDLVTGRVLWERAVATAAAEPVVVDGMVLVAESDIQTARLRALSAESGSELWRIPLQGLFLPGYEAAVDHGQYVVADDAGGVSMVDLGTRTVRWRAPANRHQVNLTTTLLVGPMVVAMADGAGPVTIDRVNGAVARRAAGHGLLRALVRTGTRVYALVTYGTASVVSARQA